MNRSGIDQDCESKSRMFFCFIHHRLGGLVDEIIGTVPVDNDAVNAAADHIGDLALHLGGIGGAVADVHVTAIAKPKHQMSEDFCSGAGVEHGVDVHFAHVVSAQVPV